MQYMLFVCTDSTAPAYDPAQDNIEEWVKDVYDGGTGLHGDRLRPVTDATTVKVRDGQLRVSAGPFAETTEWIAGYDVIDCSDLDEAIDIASRHPMAKFGQIEIRPVWPLG
jgi:hypothetical protein